MNENNNGANFTGAPVPPPPVNVNINNPQIRAPRDKEDFFAERTLNVVAKIVLILGLISSFAFGASRFDSHDNDTRLLGAEILVGGCLLSIAIYAFFKVVANISIHLRQIKFQMQNKQ
jgi:hypothetical protein